MSKSRTRTLLIGLVRRSLLCMASQHSSTPASTRVRGATRGLQTRALLLILSQALSLTPPPFWPVSGDSGTWMLEARSTHRAMLGAENIRVKLPSR